MVRAGRLLATVALAGVVAGLGWAAFDRYTGRARHPVASAPVPVASAIPNTLVDPLAPGRPVTFDASERATDGGNWVTARPGFQYSRPPAERGGANPCGLPEADTSDLHPWKNLAKGRVSMPRQGALDASGNFDLVIHLHGDELARRELAASRQSSPCIR